MKLVIKRREFVKLGAGWLLLATPMSVFVSKAWADSDSAIIADLEQKDLSNSCQSIDNSESAAALLEVNSNSQPGIFSNSIGCKSPHKHILFLPQQYLSNPRLIEQEADTQGPDGSPAKTFMTSKAFDMSFMVRMTVGAHQHAVILTQADLVEINASGLDKIAYQKALLGGGAEPGHVFHLAIKAQG